MQKYPRIDFAGYKKQVGGIIRDALGAGIVNENDINLHRGLVKVIGI